MDETEEFKEKENAFLIGLGFGIVGIMIVAFSFGKEYVKSSLLGFFVFILSVFVIAMIFML